MIFIRYILFLTIFITSLAANDISKVSLQLLWKHQFEFAGFYIAKEKGFYKDAGLDVQIKEFDFGINITNEIESGRSTFGVGYPSIILDKSNGKNVVLLSTIFQSSPHVLVSLKSSGIKSIKDFRNKKVMIGTNGIKTASLLSMLYSNEIYMDDIIQVDPSFNIDDLINKKVDVFSSYLSNEIYKLDKNYIKYNIWNPKDYGFDFYTDILFTSSKELKNNPQKVEKFRAASLKGWEYAFSNIEETVELILEKYNTQKKDKNALLYEAKVLKQLAYSNKKELGKIDKNKIQRIYDIYNLMGLTKNKIDLDKFIYQPSTPNNTLTKNEKDYLKNKKVIKMCNNPNWEPIEFAQNGNMNNMSGIAIDTLKVLEEKLNIKFQNIPTKSWSESQQFLKEKKCDILPCAVKTSKREKYANFTKPYLKLPLAIFTAKDKPLVSSLSEIIDKPWSRKKGSVVIAKIKKEYPQSTVIETKDNIEALQLVNNGDVYFTIATLPVASNVISKHMLNNIQITGYSNISFNLSMAVRDDNMILLSILDKALNNISQEEYNKIFTKWVSSPVKEAVTDYKLVINILVIVFIIIFFLIYRQYILHKSNKDLKIAVENKTKDLQELNENLEENINSFIHLIEASLKTYNLNLIVDVDKQIEIYGFANELIQCYINIFNNAKDVLKNINDEDKFIFISGEIKNDNVIIKIKDNGGGIPNDVLTKIFDPYFTTKHKNQGTGLGLHMTYNLITEGMNGNIEAKNVKFQYNDKKYTGAQFEITLPKN